MKRLISRAALMLLAVLLTTTTAWAKAEPSHKIVVIADPHVMAPELLQSDGTAWQNYLAGSRKMIDKSQALFNQTVSNISGMAVKPELVLIVGDLTKDGEQASHDYVKGKLSELKTAGIPTLVIPGNHDLGTTDAKVYDGENTSDATVIGTAAAFATQYADYGYGTSSDRLENTLTYACEPVEGLVVIGIDSGTDGVLSDATLNWVCTKATAARAAGKQVIAMMHHPLIPHITGGNMFVETVSVANYEFVRNRLADAGITTIFTGHFHTSDIAKDWNGGMTKPIYDITTGSLCSYPCDYRVVTLNNDLTAMSIATSTATGDNTITANDAKGRLYTCMKAKVKAKSSLISDELAGQFADAYIYHAEGNENENAAAQTLKTQLNSLLTYFPSYNNMINSMLLDKSNYGVAYREDQTNDRELYVTTFNSDITLNDGDVLTGTILGNHKISIANGATVTLNDVTINGIADLNCNWAGITCEGNATLILNGKNTVKCLISGYPGIQAGPSGTTLTIQGTGSLDASSKDYAGGIGAESGGSCGNIVIQGSVTVTATGGDCGAGIGCGGVTLPYHLASCCDNITIQGSANVTAIGGKYAAGIGTGQGESSAKSICGNILISGTATVNATGGMAGIGSSWHSQCGTITIASTVSKVTATRGDTNVSIIGAGDESTCGTVTIDGVENATPASTFTNYISDLSNSDNTWTLTKKKDFTKCKATVGNPTYIGTSSYVGYSYENGTGIEVYDEEKNLLKINVDYYFSGMETLEPAGTYPEGDVACSHLGEHCRVKLTGAGDYAGTLTADVVITLEPAKDSWGSLNWEYKDCVLTISGSGDMPTESNYDQYPWFSKKNGIKTIIIGDGVTSVAAKAFGSPSGTNYYNSVETITLPTKGLKSIGSEAFAFCGGTIDLDNVLQQLSVADIGDYAFNKVGKLTCSLSDKTDNTNKIELLSNAQRADVTINRALYKDGNWNTLCLPFDLQDGDYRAHPEYEATPENYSSVNGGKDGKALTGTLLEGCTLLELDIADVYTHITGFENGTLYLNFKPAMKIEAGKPYIIKWPEGDKITSLEFKDVHVSYTSDDVTSVDNNVTFKGTYTSTTFTAEDKNVLFLGASNKLYYPQPGLDDAKKTVTYPSIGAFRAFFQLADTQWKVKEFRLNFGEEDSETSLNEELRVKSERYDDAIYDLSGRKVNSQLSPVNCQLSTVNRHLSKGIYIKNGKKILVK